MEGRKKSKKSINVEGGNVRGGWKKIKINKRVSTFITEMRVTSVKHKVEIQLIQLHIFHFIDLKLNYH